MDKQEVFYVGIGNAKRPYTHRSRNQLWHKVVSKYNYIVVVIHDELTYLDACILEKQYIKQFGRRCNNTGSLVNFTEGGEGIIGLIPWNKNKTKKIDIRIEKIARNRKGIVFSKTHIKNMSNAQKGKPCLKKGKTYEEMYGVEKAKLVKMKSSLSHLGQASWNKGLTKKENSNLKGNKTQRSLKTKKLMSESSKKRFSNPIERQKASKRKSKPIKQYTLNNEFVQTFSSAKFLSVFYNKNKCWASNQLLSKPEFVYDDFIFRYD